MLPFLTASAVDFLTRQASEIGLECQVVESYSGFPVVVMTLIGYQPQLKSIILNSHMDVVPVFEVCQALIADASYSPFLQEIRRRLLSYIGIFL